MPMVNTLAGAAVAGAVVAGAAVAGAAVAGAAVGAAVGLPHAASMEVMAIMIVTKVKIFFADITILLLILFGLKGPDMKDV